MTKKIDKEFIRAVEQGDVQAIATILKRRNRDGTYKLDVNQIETPPDLVLNSAVQILWRTCLFRGQYPQLTGAKAIQIIEYLLAQRDQNHNPLVEYSFYDLTLFANLNDINSNFFTNVHPIPHMIEFLLDRGARPTAFQREIFKTSPFFKNLEQQQREHNIALPEWVERVLAAQPLTAEEIVSNERAIKQNIERVNELVRGATTEVARINQNTQNIHLPETERSEIG